MVYKFTPFGVCARQIVIDIDEETEIINSIKFVGGCAGNTQGVARLAAGRKLDDLIAALKGVDCNGRGTSCPDQLARALEELSEQL